MNLQSIHRRSLEISTRLSGYFVKNFIKPLDVMAHLNGAGIRFLLVGAHAFGGWMREPRASQSIEILTAARTHRRAVKLLLGAFRTLEPEVRDENAFA
jgi:hypothetical protein